ncbi:hypothetical protein [Pontibacillus yanchengensis]|uniref:Uncharacterized protein n=1 Tax=Pontibacillus yanchengensis Y32 TaxID=1385514 RepID=A0A0A2TNV9_9BACI|nr:hypothetical protein [Pontibacillus yanchengensis]KGP71025.1 hypothetical protein N782_01815 [Pontibacillus yanchengensis Y32]
MNLKALVLTFIFVYFMVSLPGILGVGYVIDWVPGTSNFQKFKGYLFEGLTQNILIKTVIAFIVGIIVSLIISMRSQSKRNSDL